MRSAASNGESRAYALLRVSPRDEEFRLVRKSGNYWCTGGQPCPSWRGNVATNEMRRLADKAVRNYVPRTSSFASPTRTSGVRGRVQIG